MEHPEDKWHWDGASRHRRDTRQKRPGCGGHVNQLNTQTPRWPLLQEPSEEMPETTWVVRFAQGAAGSWVHRTRGGKKWEISSSPRTLPAEINSSATRELSWQTSSSFPALCFPLGTPRSPFPSPHQLPSHPPFPRLDQEQHYTRGQHPAPPHPPSFLLLPKRG